MAKKRLMVCVDGSEMSLIDAALARKISPSLVQQRLRRLGWTLEQALGIEQRPQRMRRPVNGEKVSGPRKTYQYDGGEYSLKEISQKLNLPYHLLYYRVKRGMPLDEAVSVLAAGSGSSNEQQSAPAVQ